MAKRKPANELQLLNPLSSKHPRFDFDVFLSFRGEDTRKGFTGFLHEALKQRGINVFIDNEGLEKGKRVEELFRFIRGSEMFIPIFSKGYAESKWCLMEIAEIVQCGRLVLPIFYDVEPREVRNAKGPFEAAFRKHDEDDELREKTKEWREALRKVGEVSGYDLKTETQGHEAKLIQVVVKRVLSEINKIPLDVAAHPVGMEPRVKAMMKLLDIEADDVRIIGICGEGGIGKTTIAKAIYNEIFLTFDGSSFISDIAEMSASPSGLVTLQTQLIRDILKTDDIAISSTAYGINLISRRISRKKVLLILDNVNHLNQLNALAGRRDWFGPGSRIIVTTREEQVLLQHQVTNNEIYKPKTLNAPQSLQLFIYHAFMGDERAKEYEELSKKVVLATGGLPLTIEIFGSHFFDIRAHEDWEEMLGKLQEFQDKDIFSRLKISYDKLDDAEKSILLDIACFFVGKGRENALHMWKDSRLYPTASIRTLMHKSLIKISNLRDEFEMHDQIRDMARQIVLQEGRSDPGKRSRLWDPDEILDVLNNAEGSRKIEGIVFNSEEGSKTYVRTKAFKKMLNLRLLHVNNTHIQGKFECFPKKLKWLEWRGCPLKSLSDDFSLEKVVVLNLSSSMITNVWNMRGMIDVVLNNIRCMWRNQPQPRGKIYSRMKVLDLSNCVRLVATPSFYCLPELVKLVVDGCVRLAKIDKSIGELKNLGILTMGRCIRLKELPYEICKLSCLKKLNLYECKNLSNLPEELEGMESLTELILESTSIRKLPESIGRLVSLEELVIKGTRIEGIPETIQHLANLELLDASYCRSLSALPNSIGEAKSLKQLVLDETPIQELPNSIGDLDQLESLSIRDCDNISVLPDSARKLKGLIRVDLTGTKLEEAPIEFESSTRLKSLSVGGLTMISSSFFNISCLEDLYASKCTWLEDVLCDFGEPSSLKSLNLDHGNFCEVPSNICNLSQLWHLSLVHCHQLQSIPTLPSSLVELYVYNSDALRSIADVSNLKKLKELDLTSCLCLVNVPGLETLESLEQLNMDGCRDLCDELKNKLKDATFECLESFSISGSLILGGPTGQLLKFVFPKNFTKKHEVVLKELLLESDFNYIWKEPLTIEVMDADDSLVYGTQRNADEEVSDWCRVTFEEDDEIQRYMKDGFNVIHVSMHGLQLTGGDIFLQYPHGFDEFDEEDDDSDVDIESDSLIWHHVKSSMMSIARRSSRQQPS